MNNLVVQDHNSSFSRDPWAFFTNTAEFGYCYCIPGVVWTRHFSADLLKTPVCFAILLRTSQNKHLRDETPKLNELLWKADFLLLFISLDPLGKRLTVLCKSLLHLSWIKMGPVCVCYFIRIIKGLCRKIRSPGVGLHWSTSPSHSKTVLHHSFLSKGTFISCEWKLHEWVANFPVLKRPHPKKWPVCFFLDFVTWLRRFS